MRAALEGDGALLARMVRDSSALDVLGSPRDFSTARYATVCETEPMPWDPGTPIDQRPAVVQQRIAALPPSTFAPFDPPVVVGDEIDLCLRWPDVPRPPSTAAALPYPTMPTLILQGGEDLRTPPEVSERIAARIPGSVRLVVPGTGHSTVSDPRTCSRDAIDRFIEGKSLPKSPCKRIPTGIPAVLSAPESFESLRVSGGLPRKIGRTVSALGATLDDLRLVVSPAALATGGGGLRGGSWSISGDRLVLKRYAGRQRGDRDRQRRREDHAARRWRQGRARDGHAPLRRPAVRDARRASRSRSDWARRTSSAAKASVALKLAR